MINVLLRKKIFYLLLLTTLVITILLSGCSIQTSPETGKTSQNQTEDKLTETPVLPSASHLLQVTFMDVGQADSIFIKLPEGKTMLIDAGNNNDGKTIINYIKNQGTKKLDTVIGTHPHEDHIGAMDDIINTFDIGKIYMPNVTTTTRTFKDVLASAAAKGLKIISAKGGMTILLEDDVNIEIFAPNSKKYEDLNNYSIVLKMTYKKTSFLFTGDAEKLSEEEMLKHNYDLKADVLKVGHHGSSSGTSEEFLSAVSPEYAIISVGKNNDYGHPHKETLERLAAHGVKVYTTADNGNILVTSDGENIKISRAPNE
ncbi:MAG: MBL fold metallo-hydrolase [Tepidanaerobacteraceae bacterium]|jgi:beta-lactamase superfamily II metal-dependent hydrolase|nr:MBL fold metallo-hydrolase [Tepidanaerobacteraceae bacterium]